MCRRGDMPVTLEDRVSKLEDRYLRTFEENSRIIAKLTANFELSEGRFARIETFMASFKEYFDKREASLREETRRELKSSLENIIESMQKENSELQTTMTNMCRANSKTCKFFNSNLSPGKIAAIFTGLAGIITAIASFKGWFK